MLTHTEKVKLARHPGMQTRAERSTRERITPPSQGMMISRLFSTKAWHQRKSGMHSKNTKIHRIIDPKMA